MMKRYLLTTANGEMFRLRAKDITDLPVEINGSEVTMIAKEGEDENE